MIFFLLRGGHMALATPVPPLTFASATTVVPLCFSIHLSTSKYWAEFFTGAQQQSSKHNRVARQRSTIVVKGFPCAICYLELVFNSFFKTQFMRGLLIR